MHATCRRAVIGLMLLLLAGCDGGSGGPSAPSPAPVEPGSGNEPGNPKPETLPLKKVGAPIG